MGRRIDLQRELVALLGSKHVYYQPPSSIKLQYPCIIYSLDRPDIKRADDRAYLLTHGYKIVIVSEDPDNDLADKMIEHFPMARISSPRYVADNLYHDVVGIYY